MANTTVRTTLTLPTELLEAVDQAVKAGQAQSRNEWVRLALERELAAQKGAAIDAAFAGMAEDSEHQREAQAIADAFATADWEAWQHAEEKGSPWRHSTGLC